MKNLIQKLKAATEPSADLDREIKLAYAACLIGEGKTATETISATAGDLYDDPRPYTQSIDAAMSLMPELVWLEIETGTQADGARAGAWPIVACGSNKTGETIWKGQAITLPITLCIAAFEAHAALTSTIGTKR